MNVLNQQVFIEENYELSTVGSIKVESMLHFLRGIKTYKNKTIIHNKCVLKCCSMGSCIS